MYPISWLSEYMYIMYCIYLEVVWTTYAPWQVVGLSWSSELCHCLASPHRYCTLHLLLGEGAGRGGEGEGWGGGVGRRGERRRGGGEGGRGEGRGKRGGKVSSSRLTSLAP